MTPFGYSPEAREDLREIRSFLGAQSVVLAERFEADYRKAFEKVLDDPKAWPKVGRNVRVKAVSKRFSYGIYYQYRRKTVYIGAVIGLKRHPAYWKHRF